MRKIFILIILFSMSWVLQSFDWGTDSQQSILLAIGFVILAAYTLSEIGSSLTLPQVTGYILAGLLLGPYALNILSNEVVQEIKVFNTLAIGLIAITAGLELHFQSLKKVIGAIASTTTLKIVFLTVLVTGTIVGLEMGLGLFGFDNPMTAAALGLVFSALCLGTSPAISLAVISETKAKGRMSQLVLGSAIVKDVVVIIALAVALSVANSMLGAAGDGVSATELLKKLGLSLVAGCVLGGIFIAYIRFIHQEMFLFIAAMIFITSEVSEAVHLNEKLLLIFIVAGIVVRNFSKEEKLLHDPLEKVSLPIFVVFFTNVGADLNLQSTWDYLPIAGGLFAARALAFFGSGYLSGSWHNEKPAIQQNVWLGYLPQAGVTLGLLGIAFENFENAGMAEFAGIIKNLGMGLVTLNLLIGPITLRIALKKNRETSNEEVAEVEKPLLQPEENETIDPDNEDAAFENLMAEQQQKIPNEEIRNQFLLLNEKVYQIFKKNQLAPQKSILEAFSNDLNNIYDLSESEIVEKIDEHFDRMGQKGREIYNSIATYQDEIGESPVAMEVPLKKYAISIQKTDSFGIRLLKIIKRPKYWFIKEPKRVVPFRKTAKYNLEPFVGSYSLHLINSWFRLLGLHIETFQRNLESHTFDQQDIIEKIRQENQMWVDKLMADFIVSLKKTNNEWLRMLNEINTIYLPDSKIRYSHVEPEIKESFNAAKQASIEWEEKFIYCRNRLKVIVQTALLSSAVGKLIEEKFFSPVDEAKKNADNLVGDVFGFFDTVENELNSRKIIRPNFFTQLHKEAVDFSKNHLQADIKSKYIRGSFRLLNRDITMNLKKSLPKEEGSFQITSEQTPPHEVRSPSEIMVKKINLHELFEQSILISFLPTIEEKIEGISNYLESLVLEMEQAFSILIYAFDSQSSSEKELSDSDVSESILHTLSTERDKISELHKGLTNYIDSSKEAAEKLIDESQQQVKEGIERFSVVTTAKNQFRQSFMKVADVMTEQKDKVVNYFDGIYQKAKHTSRYDTEREIDKVLSKKITNKTLDTTTIRQFIEQTYTIDPEFENLPRVYFRLFSMDPIQDKRFFIAHQDKWQFIEPLTQTYPFQESHKILVLGERGIGKSSLLNVAQMEIRTDKLIRIEEPPLASPINTLAQILGCQKGFQTVLKSLKRQSTTIIIDNIDQWLNKKNIDDFVELLDLIKQSPHQAHWILSMTECNFDSFDKAFKIKSIFNKIVDLTPTDQATTKEVILSRQRLSGLKIEYPKNILSEWAVKLGFSEASEMFFRLLDDRAHGHLRHMIFLWLLSLDSCDTKHLFLSSDKGMDRGLPFIHEFSNQQKFILSQIYRYHRQTSQQIVMDLGVSQAVVDNELQYLEYSGLLKHRGVERTTFEIPNHLVHLIGKELKQEGFVYESASAYRSK